MPKNISDGTAGDVVWYLLYDGSSSDGIGWPDYVGRTTSVKVAKKHFKKCKSDRYCTGKVLIVTDTKETKASYESDFVSPTKQRVGSK